MPKSKKPRKKYNPMSVRAQRAATSTPLHAVLQRNKLTPIDPRTLRELQICNHAALKAMEEGKGTEDDTNMLAVAVNAAMLLCEANIGAEFMSVVDEAKDAIREVEKRRVASGRVGLSGPSMMALRRLLELHDQQLEHPDCTEGLMHRMMDEMRRRIEVGAVEQLQ